MRLSVVVAFAFAFSLPLIAGATPPDDSSKQSVTSAFHKYVTVTPTLTVPTVLEVPLEQSLISLPVIAVYNLVTNEFEPYMLNAVAKGDTPSQVQATRATGSTYALTDGSYDTYLEFPLREGANQAEITFTFAKTIIASSLSFSLDAYVALPQTVRIETETPEGSYTALATTRLQQTSMTFPKTTAAVWRVTFEYAQPLRITEMKFNEYSAGAITSRSVRFLAQPGQSYQLYVDADRYVHPVLKEAADLTTSKGVVVIAGTNPVLNPSYTPADSDNDTIPDLIDNCVSIANQDQKDTDANGRGDACEDYDRDGVMAANDNCPDVPNQSQIDTDADGIGDACDTVDNRVTEQMPWLPWVGIGVAGVVTLGLFILAFRYKKQESISTADNAPHEPLV